jgi:hypothetical protein
MLARRQAAVAEEPVAEPHPASPEQRPAAENVTPLTLSERKRVDP